jgi:queuine/archaeosine tRNA-ribosyltransferase
MSLIYVPVSTGFTDLVNKYHPNCLFNPVRQNSKNLIQIDRPDFYENFADSGGYQLYSNEFNIDKPSMVMQGVGIKNEADVLVIDPIDLCRCYGELKDKYGFTLDEPISDNLGLNEYSRKRKNSYRWAKLMFNSRNKLCPNTELFVPLHFITKKHLHHYVEKTLDLNPDGYAFPARSRFEQNGLIKISYVLCFLNNKSVKKVHLLGSSRQEVITIAAAAVGLKMFNQISFDSRTWNTAHFNTKPIIIDSKTLRQRKIMTGEKINLFVPKTLLDNSSLYDSQNFKKLLVLHNAYAISKYAKNLAEIATDISSLKCHLSFLRLNGKQSERILAAIDVLETYSVKGYGYLEKWLSCIWF